MAVQEGGAGAKGHRIVRPGMGPTHHGERASERSLSQKERDIARSTGELGPEEGGGPRNSSGHGKNTTEWGVLTCGDRSGRDASGKREESDLARGVHEPEPGEGGTCQERGIVRSHEGHSPLGAAEGGRVRTWKESK